jgi:hypothetical protein
MAGVRRGTLAPCTVACCESPTDRCTCEKCTGRNHGLWLRENRARWFAEHRPRTVDSSPRREAHARWRTGR